jgi:hypothetical protein
MQLLIQSYCVNGLQLLLTSCAVFAVPQHDSAVIQTGGLVEKSEAAM